MVAFNSLQNGEDSDEKIPIYRRTGDVCPTSSRGRNCCCCRSLGISQATFYIWKKKYGELGASEVRRLRQLEDENARLKRLVADLTLDKNILQEVIKKKI